MILGIFLQEGGSLMSMLPILAMILVFYLFMIRPQMKRQKNERSFQETITKGSNIVTSSGIHGKIVEVNDKDNTLMIETNAGKIKFERSSISMELSNKKNAVK
ncbi:MAG: preprotein translocase subunit YajC [Candidatus Azotimanducaceae bacterium]|jgi:preprotein translocase subunit YajC